MHCRDAEILLDRQIDGDLTPQESDVLAAHITGCASCSRAVEQIAYEQRVFKRVSGALHEHVSVWPAVRAAIHRGSPRKARLGWTWRRMLYVGAPALAAALLFLILSRPEQSPGPADASAQAAVLDAQTRYLRAIETVRQDVFAHLAQLPPETAASLTAGLTELDATIAAARDAWRTSPDDPLATRYLLSAYAHKLELLMRFVTAS